jgi:hypothetical protein
MLFTPSEIRRRRSSINRRARLAGVPGQLTDEQVERLLTSTDKCPVNGEPYTRFNVIETLPV